MMFNIDQTVQAALNSQSVPGYYPFFSLITILGSAYAWIAVLLVPVVLGRWRKPAAILIITLLVGTVVNEDIKNITQRLRPEDINIAGYYTSHSYSFPSGHTQTAFTIATVLTAFIALRYNLITYLLALAVGMSRIYLGVHYFTDVVFGAVTGIILGELAIYGAYRMGLIAGGGIFEAIEKLHDKRETPDPGEVTIMNGLAMLIFGLATAMVLMLMGQYLVSLAALIFAYIMMLQGARDAQKCNVC